MDGAQEWICREAAVAQAIAAQRGGLPEAARPAAARRRCSGAAEASWMMGKLVARAGVGTKANVAEAPGLLEGGMVR